MAFVLGRSGRNEPCRSKKHVTTVLTDGRPVPALWLDGRGVAALGFVPSSYHPGQHLRRGHRTGRVIV